MSEEVNKPKAEEKPHTFHIPAWNMEKLRLNIHKINTKAVKLGCPEVTLEIIREYQERDPAVDPDLLAVFPEFVPLINMVEVAVHVEAPIKLAGWAFLGTLDHYSLPGTVIVNTVPGQSIPSQFFHSEAICEHCGKQRRRIETFVLQHEDGQYKQVGRQCIKDFLGHDPKAVLAALTRIRKLIDDLDDEEVYSGGSCGHHDYVFDHTKVLAATAAVIRKYGWISRTVALIEGKQATADGVRNVFFPPFDKVARTAWEKWVRELNIDDERNGKDAAGAQEWLEERRKDDVKYYNEYMHNLYTIADADAVPSKFFGYWCSLMSAYYKALDKIAAANRHQKVNEYFGEVKDKIEIVVDVTGIRNIDTYYGGATVINMLDEGGRTVVWMTSSDNGFERGGKYKIKATIKKHEEYNGWKQTHIIRVKILEELKPGVTLAGEENEKD